MRQTRRAAYPKCCHMSLSCAKGCPAACPLLAQCAPAQPCWPLGTVITWHCCTPLISPGCPHVGSTDAGGNTVPENGMT